MLESKSPIKVTYKFELPQHEQELSIMQRGEELLGILYDIDTKCRLFLRESAKTPKAKEGNEFVEELREFIKKRMHIDQEF